MLSILGSLIIVLWLLLAMNRKKQSFFEASIFTIVMMGFSCLMQQSWPDVNNAWLLTWVAHWLFVFIALWLFDIIAVSTTSAVVYSLVVSVGYYYFESHIFTLVEHWLSK